MSLLAPAGLLLALGIVLPLLALLLVRRRATTVRRGLALVEPPSRALVVTVLAVAATGALVGIAAAQPVVEQTRTLRERTDAEAFVVVDVSRSMLAQSGTDSPRRLERAKTLAKKVRAAFPQIKFGVVSMTDRTLPHLFPSADREVFDATLDRSLGIEKPPPRSSLAQLSTNLEALAYIRSQRYFAPKARKRLLVVLTDGESQPTSGARLARLFGRPPVTHVVFVHVWGADERVFTQGAPEPQYRPDEASREVLDGLAKTVSGNTFSERDVGAVIETARGALGSGPTVVRGEQGGRVALAPYFAAAALLPLALLLWRRDR
jgi:von Willebrand factor type A domain